MASSVPEESGPAMVAEVKAAGATEAAYSQLTREEALKPDSAKILEGAGGVYFCGGDQSRLTEVLLDTPIHRKMLELYARGLVVSGTSAGAAVMSEVMITGDEKRTKDEERELADDRGGKRHDRPRIRLRSRTRSSTSIS